VALRTDATLTRCAPAPPIAGSRSLHGEVSPHLAPLLLSYGKSLFEVAVSQQGVLGREELAKEQSAWSSFSSWSI
jgi:hypothetical protein